MGINIFFVVILCLEVPLWLQGPLLLGLFASVFLVLGDSPPLPSSVATSVRYFSTLGGMMLLSLAGISLFTGFLLWVPSSLYGWGVLALFFGSLLRFSFDYSFDWSMSSLPWVHAEHTERRRRRSTRHKANARFHWSYCRKYPFHAAMRARRNSMKILGWIPNDGPNRLRRWQKRRNRKARARMRRRRAADHSRFLRVGPKTSLLSKASISESTLNAFCETKGKLPDYFVRLP